MKAAKKKARIRSKGDRLNWPLLKDVKPVPLTPELLIGVLVTPDEIKKHIRPDSPPPRLLVP